MFLTTNAKAELESLATREPNSSCEVKAMEPGQQQEREMGGSGKSSANKTPLSSASQGQERGEHDSAKGGNEQLTNRAALRKGKWTVRQAAVVACLGLVLYQIVACCLVSLTFPNYLSCQVEEEEYTSRIIHYFNTGLLTLPEGATLRSYLADKLNCDPMRVTKKYAGASCLGRRVYHFHNRPQPTVAQIQLAKAELDLLEQRFRQRVEEGRSGGPNPSTSLLMNSFNYAAAQAQPTNAFASPAAALQALLMNLAAATAAASSPPAPLPQASMNSSSGILGMTQQQALQQSSVQSNAMASNAILEALGLQYVAHGHMVVALYFLCVGNSLTS
jgi:hypothetical protein